MMQMKQIKKVYLESDQIKTIAGKNLDFKTSFIPNNIFARS